MFDLGWSEILLIAVVAFVLLGPQDLVRVMRKVGYWIQKARLTLVTFQRMLDAATYDEDIRKLKKDLQHAGRETTQTLGAQIPEAQIPEAQIPRAVTASVSVDTAHVTAGSNENPDILAGYLPGGMPETLPHSGKEAHPRIPAQGDKHA
jgi:Tat protein translocase TatB subunit